MDKFNYKRQLLTMVLFVISALSLSQVLDYQTADGDSKTNTQWINHTHTVILLTERLLSSVKDTETGQRGYLLTRTVHYLAPYYTGQSKSKEILSQLKEVTLDNAGQQERLNEMEQLINRKSDELQETINLGANNKYDEALIIVKNDSGKQIMDDFRVLIKAFIKEENKLLVQRKQALQDSLTKDYYMVRGMLLFLLLIVFLFIYKTMVEKENLTKVIKEKTVALNESNENLILLNGSLESEVSQRTEELTSATHIAEDALAAKSTFLANMSHEIRTPLNAILGFIHLLENMQHDEKHTKYLKIINASSKSLLNVIEDILDYSKLESKKVMCENIDISTQEEFEIISHLFNAKCSEKSIMLVVTLDESLPEFINTDPLKIRQIVSNLLSNAIKFTQKNKRITLKFSYSKELLHVSVEDEGKGIAKEKISTIFESFTQEDSSTTRKYGGTGLGLSISKSLVEVLGGELMLKSTVGKGSEFYFSIPVTVATKGAEEAEEIQVQLLEGSVLVVEDNKTNQILIEVFLEELSLTCEFANNGQEAINMFNTKKYDLILMDENMPVMGGIEATSNILDLEKVNQLSHTPIIALTANALSGDKERFLKAGMDEYVAKPIDSKKLFTALVKFLKIKQ